MKTIRITKFLGTLYQYYEISTGVPMRDHIFTLNNILIGPGKKIKVTFDTRGSGAYTSLERGDASTRRVVLGGGLVKQIAGLPDTITDKAVMKTLFSPSIKAIMGLNLHEMGHNLFTDMVSRDIVDYKDINKRGLLHSLFNIIEDYVVEESMVLYYKKNRPYDISPRKFFDFTIQSIFEPQAERYKDTGANAGNFMQYLLLLLRCGKSAIKETNAVFEAHKAEFVPKLQDVLMTSDATARLKATVALGEWMFENIPEIKWEMEEPPAKEKKSGSLPIEGGMPSSEGAVSSGELDKKLGSPAGATGKEEGAEGGGEPKESSGDEKEKEKEKEGTGEKDEEEDKSAPMPDFEADDEITDEVFNDEIHDGDDHEFVIAKDEYTYDGALISELDEELEKVSPAAQDVSKFLTLFKGRTRPRMQEGFTKGKVNLRRAMQDEMRDGCDLKLFKQPVRKGRDTDAAFWLLGDNSGSMSGSKSRVCAKGILTMAQACDWAKVPFCASCFTKTCDSYSGTCITIIEKDFEDEFEKAKPYFGINSSSTIDRLHSDKYIPTFAGNSEEINLFYIWKRFQRVNHKTKILMVLCDGATTGSRDSLKRIVRQIEDDGIIVIGLGIMCSEVANIYPRHKLFGSMEELERELPQYLIDTLSEYAI